MIELAENLTKYFGLAIVILAIVRLPLADIKPDTRGPTIVLVWFLFLLFTLAVIVVNAIKARRA